MTVTDQGLEQPGAAAAATATAATRPSVAVKNCSCTADQPDGTVDHPGPAPCPPLCLAVTMEPMRRRGGLMAARRISMAGGVAGMKEKQNEGRRETYWSSRVQPLSPAGRPGGGRLHRLAAQAPLGSHPVFCPNYQLCFTEEGQRGEKISLCSPPTPPPTPPLSELSASPACS